MKHVSYMYSIGEACKLQDEACKLHALGETRWSVSLHVLHR